jgi:hypothetical protein
MFADRSFLPSDPAQYACIRYVHAYRPSIVREAFALNQFAPHSNYLAGSTQVLRIAFQR